MLVKLGSWERTSFYSVCEVFVLAVKFALLPRAFPFGRMSKRTAAKKASLRQIFSSDAEWGAGIYHQVGNRSVPVRSRM